MVLTVAENEVQSEYFLSVLSLLPQVFPQVPSAACIRLNQVVSARQGQGQQAMKERQQQQQQQQRWRRQHVLSYVTLMAEISEGEIH